MAEGDLGTPSTEGIHRVDEAPDPVLGWRASAAEAQPWRPGPPLGRLAQAEWSGQHAHPWTPQAMANAKAEATRMTSVQAGVRVCFGSAPFCSRPLRAAQGTNVGSRSWRNSIPRGILPAPPPLPTSLLCRPFLLSQPSWTQNASI